MDETRTLSSIKWALGRCFLAGSMLCRTTRNFFSENS
jgi:hypothetical protein